MTGAAGALDVRRLEEASLRAWPAIEEHRLDGWTLRHSEGFTGRANSVQALGGSARPLDERVAECERWYEERRRPCLFRLSNLSEAGLEDFLDGRGYGLSKRTLVLRREAGRPWPERGDVELVETPLYDWLRSYAGFSRLPAAPGPMGRIIQRIGGRALLGRLWRSSPRTSVACGLAVLDGPLVGLFDLVVAPEERRKGYGTTLVGKLTSWGAERGGRTAYLQVTEENLPALALYEELGFRLAYDYWYRSNA